MKWLVIIITAMFTGAKLAHAINWSWWLVFSPAIAYYGLIITFIIMAMIVCLVMNVIDIFKRRFKNASSKHED